MIFTEPHSNKPALLWAALVAAGRYCSALGARRQLGVDTSQHPNPFEVSTLKCRRLVSGRAPGRRSSARFTSVALIGAADPTGASQDGQPAAVVHFTAHCAADVC
jgi:hypothetical protein